MKFLGLLFIMLALLAIGSPVAAQVIPDPGRDARREMLITHGVNTDAPSLIRFLERGFSESAMRLGLPRAPQAKSAVVNAAIEELGILGDPVAVPILSELAQRRIPAGVESVIARDFEGVPLNQLDDSLLLARRVLSLNAVVSLGLIGDPTARETILSVMDNEPGSAFVVRGAEALGMMNLNDGIPRLLNLAERNLQSDISVAAFETLFILTGRNYGFTEVTALARRREILGEARSWWQANPQTNVFRHDVIRRLSVPIPPPATDPTSLRGMLRSTLNVADFDARFFARQRLATEAPERFNDLRAIAEDRNEDLDIRRAALQWMVMVDARRARATIRRQRNDENPLIAETARSLEQDIPLYMNR